MILQRLRDETSLNHAAIEAKMPVLDPDLSKQDYRLLIARFWGYYAPLEEKLAEAVYKYWPGQEYDCAERFKVPLLEKDLQSLNASAEAHQRCRDLPNLNTPGQVLGCLYVLEGSTLGGQIISRHLLANLGLGPDSGAAFFNGYGANSGSQWQSFRTFLTKNSEIVKQDDEIVMAANATFQSLGRWLFPNAWGRD